LGGFCLAPSRDIPPKNPGSLFFRLWRKQGAVTLLWLALAVGSGVLLGAGIVWMVLRSVRAGEAATERGELRARLEERSARAAALETELGICRRQNAESAAARERLAAELDHERRAAAEKLALVSEAETKLREAFQTLSAEALRQNNQSFLDLAKTSLGEFQRSAVADLDSRRQAIGELVRPVRDSL
jgi:DNA recombination protein RmuC